MSFVTRILAVWALAFCAATAAFGQGAVLQGGPSTAGRAPMYSTTGQGGQTVVQDSGPASGGAAGLGLKELLLVKRGTGTPPIANQGTGPLNTTACMYDAPINNAAGYHYLCLDPNAQGGGLLAYGAGGTASTLPFQLSINGVLYTLPFSVGGIVGPNSSTIGDLACWNGTGGNILADCSQATVAGYINIKRPPYNAACDGTTDDAAAFNSARLALQAAGGGTIFVPGGICIVGSATALFFTSGDIAIEGAGPGSVIKAKNSAALANLVTTSSAVTSFSLRNVTLDGNKANAGTNPSPTSYVLLPQNRKVRISGAEIRNAARVGLAFGPGSADIEIVTSYFHDNEIEAITNVGAPAPDDVRIVNNRFENNYITTTIGDSGAINLIATNFNVSLNYFLNNYNVNGMPVTPTDQPRTAMPAPAAETSRYIAMTVPFRSGTSTRRFSASGTTSRWSPARCRPSTTRPPARRRACSTRPWCRRSGGASNGTWRATPLRSRSRATSRRSAGRSSISTLRTASRSGRWCPTPSPMRTIRCRPTGWWRTRSSAGCRPR
jgi:hypothetical protein